MRASDALLSDSLAAYPGRSTAGLKLKRFAQLLQEIEHFCHWRQQKVAKSVPYGLPPPFKVFVSGSKEYERHLSDRHPLFVMRHRMVSNFIQVKMHIVRWPE